jgi:hypothetical protein
MKNNLNTNVYNKESEGLEEFKVALKYSTSYWDFLDKMELSKGKSDE